MKNAVTTDARDVAARSTRLESWLRWACIAAALAATLPAFSLLSMIWRQSEFLAHGYVIPAVSAWLLLSNRHAIADGIRKGPVPGLGPLLVLVASLVVIGAVSGEVVTVAGVGVPLLLGATAYAVGGIDLLRPCAVPLGFMFLMVPLPNLLELRILIELKLIVTKTAVWMLQAAGYTVASIGNRVLMPGHELFVADACSGFTSIVTMLPLSVVVAYFLSHGIWRRLVIVASVLPLAFMGNAARVFLTVAFVNEGWVSFREGLLHDNLGLATFTLGTIALVGVAKGLR
jgi:exosortase